MHCSWSRNGGSKSLKDVGCHVGAPELQEVVLFKDVCDFQVLDVSDGCGCGNVNNHSTVRSNDL